MALAKRLIEEESLGQMATPERQTSHVSDLLAINLSSNDYIGHYYGPDSAEMLDVTLKTDVQLSDFFNWLNQRTLLAQSLIVLTSDHGVSPLPAQMKSHAHFGGAIGFEAEIQNTGESIPRQPLWSARNQFARQSGRIQRLH